MFLALALISQSYSVLVNFFNWCYMSSKGQVGSIVAAVVVLVIILAVGYYFSKSRAQVPSSIPSTSPIALVTPSPNTNSMPSVNQTPIPQPSDLGSLLPETGASSGDEMVIITPQGLLPPTVYLKLGKAVGWINEDIVIHKIAAKDNFSANLNVVGELKPGNTTRIILGETGTYRYYDTVNPLVTGMIVVQ